MLSLTSHRIWGSAIATLVRAAFSATAFDSHVSANLSHMGEQAPKDYALIPKRRKCWLSILDRVIHAYIIYPDIYNDLFHAFHAQQPALRHFKGGGRCSCAPKQLEPRMT